MLMNLRDKWTKDNAEKLHVGGRYTKSVLLLLPLLGIFYKDFNSLGISYLVNCHIKDLEKRKIILILKNDIECENSFLENLVQRLSYNHYYKDSWYDGPDNQEVVLSFEMDEKWEMDLMRFIKGEYSWMSDGAKEILTSKEYYGKNAAGGFMNTASVYEILHPTKEHLERLERYLDTTVVTSEVWSRPIKQIEEYKTYKQLEEFYGIKQVI